MKLYNDLATTFPELAKEWHPTKNGTLCPSDVSMRSGEKVWWLGKCGHEWQATVSHRTDGQNCPICSNHKLLSGYNDLATKFPLVADEWHPEKNGPLKPSDVFPMSNMKVWWLGKCGHEWQCAISHRTKNNYGCPICSGKLIVAGLNDLSTINPLVAKEWDIEKNMGILPSTISPYSHKKVWWKCSECGNSWQAVIKHRNYGIGCPQCGRKKAIASGNKTRIATSGSLAVVSPQLLLEWHPIKNGTISPIEVSPNSNKKVWWVCKKGHEWQAVISSRNNGSGCPYCDQENHTSFPEQAIYYYLSKSIYVQNRVKKFGKEIDIYIPNMKIGIEYNGKYFHKSIESQRRDEAKVQLLLSQGVRVLQVVEGDSNKVESDKITYKHDAKYSELKWVIATLEKIIGIRNNIDIDIDKDRLEIYNQYIKLEKANSLATKEPDVAREWHTSKNGSLTPDNVSFGSNKKVWWIGKCGHEWQATISSRVSGHGCPYCCGKAIKEGFNDLATKYPELVDEWDYKKNGALLPSQVTAGSHKKAWWICSKCGHNWQAVIKNRVNGTRCPQCSKKARKIK